MKLPRRKFLTGATLAAAGATLSLKGAETDSPNSATTKKSTLSPHGERAGVRGDNLPRSTNPRPKFAISTYSYWHFRPPKVPIEIVIDKAAELGVGGVDILHRQMDMPEKGPLDSAGRAYLRKLKRHAFLNGVELICLSTHQTFVTPKPEELAQNVEH